MNPGCFDRSRLPEAITYFTELERLRLFGRGVWRPGLCPFHDDLQPSLRVNADVGAFRCMACAASGGERAMSNLAQQTSATRGLALRNLGRRYLTPNHRVKRRHELFYAVYPLIRE